MADFITTFFLNSDGNYQFYDKANYYSKILDILQQYINTADSEVSKNINKVLITQFIEILYKLYNSISQIIEDFKYSGNDDIKLKTSLFYLLLLHFTNMNSTNIDLQYLINNLINYINPYIQFDTARKLVTLNRKLCGLTKDDDEITYDYNNETLFRHILEQFKFLKSIIKENPNLIQFNFLLNNFLIEPPLP